MDSAQSGEQTAEVLNLAEVVRDCTQCGIIAIDVHGRICAFNWDAERLLGLPGGSLLGQPVDVLSSALRALVQECAARGAPCDRDLVLSELTPAPVLNATATPCHDPRGQPEGTILVIHDLAAVKKIGASMHRLDRLASIGTLSASLAHEIKNALVAVSTFVDDLTERNKDSELAGVVRREVHRIDAIVSQMLHFAGPAKPTFASLHLHRLLDQCLHLVQPQLEAKQLRLRRSLGAVSDVVKGDEYQLEQALLNILLNAIAATDAHGQLSVSTQRADPAASGKESIELSVTDTGVGIPTEDLGKIFEPFFSTKPNGTGLGLAITRRIIVEHGGTIEAESELRKGTTFRITLAVEAEHPSESAD
jgi:two-component system sensor histidine kinase HydH